MTPFYKQECQNYKLYKRASLSKSHTSADNVTHSASGYIQVNQKITICLKYIRGCKGFVCLSWLKPPLGDSFSSLFLLVEAKIFCLFLPVFNSRSLKETAEVTIFITFYVDMRVLLTNLF